MAYPRRQGGNTFVLGGAPRLDLRVRITDQLSWLLAGEGMFAAALIDRQVELVILPSAETGIAWAL